MQKFPKPAPKAPPPPRPPSKPVANLTVAPFGRSKRTPRDYQIKLAIDLTGSEPRFADRHLVLETLQGIFAGIVVKDGEPDPCQFSNVSARPGGPVVAVEATASSSGRPHGALVEDIRSRASQQGYRVNARETRECTHANCGATVVIPWTHTVEVAPGWYRETICGKHQYRTCAGCQSVYIMSSVSAVGQAPSVRCQVCGDVLVAWGSSKEWHAQLVSSGEATVRDEPAPRR